MNLPLKLLISTLIFQGEISADESSYWAYQKPQTVDVPGLADSFVRNPIDAFILKGLQTEKLTPNSQAERHQLIRRVFYDTTGLPPSSADLQNDQNWDQLIDQLLASPRFGEKIASHWLDLVRYAETNGFERDSEKEEMWRYRDYVIESFNSNKPYDHFLLEQLAGDQLPNKSLESSIATGFMALMQRDDEPADKPQAHADQVSDIVDVASEAFLGTTLACAKCHDHKGDPISQADYFSMMSFFDGIEKSHFKQPSHTWIDPDFEKNHHAKQHSKNQQIEALWKTVSAEKLTPFLKKSPEKKVIVGKQDKGWFSMPRVPLNPAWSLPSFDAKHFKPAGQWPSGKPLTLRRQFGLQEIPERFLIYVSSNLLELKIYLNGTLVHEGIPERINGDYLIPLSQTGQKELTTGQNIIGIIARARHPQDHKITAGIFTEPIHDMNALDYARIHPHVITDLYGADFSNRMHSLLTEKSKLDRPLKGIRYMSIKESKNIPAPKIHERGSVHAQGDPVPIGFPVVMCPPGQSDAEIDRGRRLAFAQWLTSKENPLTARVMVNRLWQYCFGKGLVESGNDFGVFGTGVTNQKLLDWLALEFMRSDWDIKHMLKLMLTSSTYQVSAAHSEESFRLDPTNALHWQHTPRRLTAEEIWDSYLIIANKLENQLGGPPIRPKMPEAVLLTSSRPDNVWRPTLGKAANRRAIYIHAKRSIKLPLLSAFDAPERDISCPSRYATTVSTQALTMLNSVFMNDLAEEFSKQLPAGELKAQLQIAFKTATCREPNSEEITELLKLATDLKETHQLSEKDLRQRLCLLILNLNETLYLD
ncbi:DUF1549 and DUF1553 domain-containing protein [bacterium]|nr:DUF1549 and DUF1553 domain-containing protein [bacterium]